VGKFVYTDGQNQRGAVNFTDLHTAFSAV